MFGLGKRRSPYGEFIDKHGITQTEISEFTGLNKATISRVCSEAGLKLRGITKKALVEAARRLSGKEVNQHDFWEC